MLSEINKLREMSHCFEAGLPLKEDHAKWLHNGIDRFLRHECTSLNDALGLKFARGGVPWWMEEAIRERDRALRDLARRLSKGRSIAEQARDIHARALRYAASSWRFDRERADMPSRYRGTSQEYLWRAFRSGAAMPLCERQLRHIVNY